MLLIISLNWIIGGGIYAIWREKTLRLTAKIAGYLILSGVLVFLIVNCLMLALKYGQASVVRERREDADRDYRTRNLLNGYLRIQFLSLCQFRNNLVY
jgi:hypothetical protein